MFRSDSHLNYELNKTDPTYTHINTSNVILSGSSTAIKEKNKKQMLGFYRSE